MPSVWAARTDWVPHPALEGDISTDVLIVGAGMAGVLTAHRLREAGVDCVVAEAKTTGNGTTGNTTAKITAQHGLIYADLIARRGMESARLYLDANTRAIADFRVLCDMYPCDFEEKTAYVYTTEYRTKLEREAKAYARLGLEPLMQSSPPLPIQTAGALGMRDQAQFNPLKLLYALAKTLPRLYENTFVHRIDGSTAITDKGRIRAKHIVLATHFPLVNVPGLYFLKLYQHRSYVIALTGAAGIDGMYVDERPDGHSFRTYGDLLLVGGGDHKTGKSGGGYAELRALAARAWPDADERYAWAAQDCMSLDALPYIGRHRAGAPFLYTATGFNKWGMTGTMMASRLLCDLLLHGKSEYTHLCAPGRSMLTPQLAKNLLGACAGLLSFGGPRCPHMGCKLRWNRAEGTWDCSCHGSRFDRGGHILDNPAKRGISPPKR